MPTNDPLDLDALSIKQSSPPLTAQWRFQWLSKTPILTKTCCANQGGFDGGSGLCRYHQRTDLIGAGEAGVQILVCVRVDHCKLSNGVSSRTHCWICVRSDQVQKDYCRLSRKMSVKEGWRTGRHKLLSVISMKIEKTKLLKGVGFRFMTSTDEYERRIYL